jgi:hypothetical protein
LYNADRLRCKKHYDPGRNNLESGEPEEMLKPLFQAAQRTSLRVRNAMSLRVWRIILLLVIVLVSSTWLFFYHSSSPTSTLGTSAAIGAVGPATTVTAQKNGIEESMQITPGPYFLSELLEVRLTLTNHNKTSFEVQGVLANDPCTGALGVAVTGGSKPQYLMPINSAFMSCPFIMSSLNPGQTVSILQDFPLTMSGPMTLAFSLRFMHLSKNKQDNQNTYTNFDPLGGHAPALRIVVAPKVPMDRVLSLQWIGPLVNVNASADAHANFRYYYTCRNFVAIDGGFTATGNFIWQSFTQSFLNLPMCSGLVSQWQFSVGAPGFSVANGSTSF